MDSNEPKKPSSDKKRFNEQFAPHLRRRLQMVLDECTIEGPARIRAVNFDATRDVMSLDVAWPFRSPWSSGDSRDQFGTKREVQALQAGFRERLLQQKIGRRLSNMLQKEIEGFLTEHLRIHKFGDEMADIVKTGAERRLAGRPILIVNKRDDAMVFKTVKSIKATLDKVRLKIKAWKKNNPTWGDDKILKRISSEFSHEMHGWLSIFRLKARTLPMFDARDGAISDIRSWRARELAAQIARDYLYREKALLRNLGELRKIISLATATKTRKK